jgi:hypothetical protein
VDGVERIRLTRRCTLADHRDSPSLLLLALGGSYPFDASQFAQLTLVSDMG